MAVWTALGTASRGGRRFRCQWRGAGTAGHDPARSASTKPATLTTGTPSIARLVLSDPADQDEVLAAAGRLAAGSTHVFSKAIAAYASSHRQSRDDTQPLTANPSIGTLPGRGVQATFFHDENPTRLGSLRRARKNPDGNSMSNSKQRKQSPWQGESWSAIGWEGRVTPACSCSLKPCARNSHGDGTLRRGGM